MGLEGTCVGLWRRKNLSKELQQKRGKSHCTALNTKLKQNISGNENKKNIFNLSFAFTVDMENGVS